MNCSIFWNDSFKHSRLTGALANDNVCMPQNIYYSSTGYNKTVPHHKEKKSYFVEVNSPLFISLKSHFHYAKLRSGVLRNISRLN